MFEPDNSLEFCRGHLDHCQVVGLRDPKMFMVQVHQLHLIVGDLLLVGVLKHEGNNVPLILSLHSDDVIIGSAPVTVMYVFTTNKGRSVAT